MDIHKFKRKINIKCYMLSNPITNSQTAPVGFVHTGLSNAFLYKPNRDCGSLY